MEADFEQRVAERAREIISEQNRAAGSLGGTARAAKLSPRRRRQIAKQAAAKRWGKK